MLAGLPVSLWLSAVLWDVVALVRPDPLWPRLAFWTLLLGLAAAVPTAATGLWELIVLPTGHPGERLAWWHMSVVSVAFGLFLASLLLRRDALGAASVPWTAIAVSATGAAATLVGGWLGGELVFHHRIAVRGDEEGDGR
jgi:uncharacterized membrane protein